MFLIKVILIIKLFIININCLNFNELYLLNDYNINVYIEKYFNNKHLLLHNNNNNSNNSNKNDQFNDDLCERQFNAFLLSVQNSEFWGIQLFDAWGKIQSGLFSGNFVNFGHFDQCLNYNYQTNNITLGDINGQYCMVFYSAKNDPGPAINIRKLTSHLTKYDAKRDFDKSVRVGALAEMNLQLGTGVCYPAACSPTLIKQSIDTLLESINMSTTVYNQDLFCHRNAVTILRPIDIFAIVFFSLFIALLITSTIYDLLTRNSGVTRKQLYLAFSIYTNGEKLFKCQRTKSTETLDCLNGLRALSIIWIILGHRFVMTLFLPVINLSDVPLWLERGYSPILTGSTVAVDTFFVLSGLLVTWSILRELNKNKKINIFKLYLHRYLRLTPVFAALILFIVTLMRFLVSGPYSKWALDMFVTDCEDYWWSALLYIQNYVNPSNVCIVHSWYLSIDMQLFILSPLILIPLWKWGKKFIWVIPLLILLSMGCIFMTTYINEFNSFPPNNGQAEQDFNRLIYYPTHTRMGAWLVGVLIGSILFDLRGRVIRIKKYVYLTIWLIAFCIIFGIIFGIFPLQQTHMAHDETRLQASFYLSLSRVSWAIALSWIIFACSHGYGGFVNWLLTWPQWQPICRLSYCMYLIHIVVQVGFIISQRQAGYFNDVINVHSVWGDFGLTISISIFWSLAFESPIMTIEKLLCGQRSRQRRKPNNIQIPTAPSISTVNLAGFSTNSNSFDNNGYLKDNIEENTKV